MATRLLPPIALALLSGACTYVRNEPYVLVTSEPLGAKIFVDGEDTGQTTPARLDLGGHLGGNHEIRLEKKGHRPEARVLVQFTETYTSKWIDGAYEDVLPPLPFFWTTGDVLTPFAVWSQLVPGELHCKLYPDDAPLLGYELLRRGEGSSPLRTR